MPDAVILVERHRSGVTCDFRVSLWSSSPLLCRPPRMCSSTGPVPALPQGAAHLHSPAAPLKWRPHFMGRPHLRPPTPAAPPRLIKHRHSQAGLLRQTRQADGASSRVDFPGQRVLWPLMSLQLIRMIPLNKYYSVVLLSQASILGDAWKVILQAQTTARLWWSAGAEF